jgi:hypothetical protein
VSGVEIGTAVVAYVEPHAGHAVEFNRWYERDHFPAAVMAGPGAFAGARFVATRACKALRVGTRFGDPARGSHLALAWLLPGAQAAWDAWVPGAVEALAAEGRMFPHRDHVHTAVYRHHDEVRAGADAPPAAQALDHPFPAVVVVAVGPGDAAALTRDLVGPAVPVAVVLAPERLVASVLDGAADAFDDHRLVVGFASGDVLAAWPDAVAPVLRRCRDRGGTLGFASPFLRTVPGTDTYADDL